MDSNSSTVDPSNPDREDGEAVSIGRPADPCGRGLRLLTFVSCFIAGVVAWGVGETSLVRVEAKLVPLVTMGNKHEGTTAATERAALIATASRNSAVLGAALGLAMAAAGGLIRRKPAGALRAALTGAALGGVAGGLAALGSVTLYLKASPSFENDLIPSLIMHGAISIALGVVAAFAFGLGIGTDKTWGRRVQLLAGGGGGALLGAVAFQVVGGLLLPIDGTAEPISTTSQARFLSSVLVSSFTAIGAAAGFLNSKQPIIRTVADGRPIQSPQSLHR
ncbi:MAG: hypothetical protein P4L85_11105 [Paludisphaera borealis]|uniref:hypothetical protein n=1 Tax=Paludisphaera borealis TaxID=1387353 RepID=UPI00284A2B97|nr:hypothetical protein [Paludisphaera borealis]MDR3619887.1 hypothetical protein [Paludisphaera borealis]